MLKIQDFDIGWNSVRQALECCVWPTILPPHLPCTRQNMYCHQPLIEKNTLQSNYTDSIPSTNDLSESITTNEEADLLKFESLINMINTARKNNNVSQEGRYRKAKEISKHMEILLK